ncbi:MAG: ribonuclease H-like domain-containing protein [Candidatus Paceibacterota bacterium]
MRLHKMNKKLSEWTIDEMESLYMQLGSFRKCAKELCCDPKTFRKYYYSKKNEMLILNGNKKFERIKPIIKNIPKILERSKHVTKSASSKLFFNPDEMNIGVFDIESTGLTGDFSCILCAVVKPYGRGKEQVFKIDLDKRDMLEAEKNLLLEFLPVLASFDGLAGYYSTRFDMPLIRTRCMFHGIPAPKKIKHFDAYFTIRRTVNPTTRRMDRINEINRLTDESLPEKSKLGVKEWTGATFRRDKESLDYIVEHCVKDVQVLESIIDKYMDFVPEKIMRS